MKSDVIVFLGPTLPVSEARTVLDAEYRPPAACGDVLRAARERPWAIGLIDGYFERVPAVWHKEILWAMTQGIHVFGAASMGALRAAELEAFGMEGVGEIFAAYRSGAIEADDEVALIHAFEDHDYRPLSDALVDLRATFAAARAAGIVSASAYDVLIEIARALFYPERSYAAVLAAARRGGEISSEEIETLQAWLPRGRVDQKRLDALAMLEEIRRRSAGERCPKEVRFTFQHTDAWTELSRDQSPHPPGPSLAKREKGVSERGESEREGMSEDEDRAWTRVFALALCAHEGVDDVLLADRVVEFCREKDLSPEALEPWLDQRGLSYEDLLRRLREDLKLQRQRRIHAAALPATLRDLRRLDDPT